MNFIKKALAITAFILILSLMVSVNVVLYPSFEGWLAAADVGFVLFLSILVSALYDLSIPGVRRVLRRAYYRAKFKKNEKGFNFLREAYIKFLVFLILLFKSAEEGFEIIKDEAHELYSDVAIFIDDHDYKTKIAHLFDIHKTKQKRASAFSLSGLGVFVVSVLAVGIMANLTVPAPSETEAATYGWIQSDWSGGSSTSTADHTDDRTGWTRYFDKDPNVDVSTAGEISLASPMEDWVETATSSFNQGTHNNTTVTSDGDGEVALLKPHGASCSGDAECNGMCCGGKCGPGVGDSAAGGVGAGCFDGAIMIAMESDISGGTNWGCRGTVLGCGDTSIGAGDDMTECIVNNCSDSGIAARLCYNSAENGYTDWFLPSRDEFKVMCNNVGGIGGFAGERYWSSSEYEDYTEKYAYYGYIPYCSTAREYKDNNSKRVRCLRNF